MSAPSRTPEEQHDRDGMMAVSRAVGYWWFVLALALIGGVHPMGRVIVAAAVLSALDLVSAIYHAYQATR